MALSKNDEFCIQNKELCIENEELCIQNEEFCRMPLVAISIAIDDFCIKMDECLHQNGDLNGKYQGGCLESNGPDSVRVRVAY